MEPIFFYFKETPLEANNKFTLDFSNTKLVYHINFSNENDYYITTMNCNLVIANDYGDLLDDIKELSTKSRLLFEKGPAHQLDLSLIELALSFPVMEKKVDEMYFLSYPENIDLCSWKYKFHDIKDNQIKDCKIFSPYTQFKNKALSLLMSKKQKNIALSWAIKIKILFVI